MKRAIVAVRPSGVKAITALIRTFLDDKSLDVRTLAKGNSTTRTTRGQQYSMMAKLYAKTIRHPKLPPIGKRSQNEKAAGANIILKLISDAFDQAIDNSTQRRRLRQRCLIWSRALAWAWIQGVSKSSAVPLFLLEKGGIEKVAYFYSTWSRNRLRKIGPKN